jgi:hypothetical protein
MNLCFVGTSECGKTTVVTLLHMRARELMLQKKKLFSPNSMIYRWSGDKDGGLDLPGNADVLSRGFPIPATPPIQGVRQSLMIFSFKNTYMLQNKELSISVVDSAGGLQQEIFALLPQRLQWTENDFETIRDRNRGMTRAVYEKFVNSVFGSEAFLFVVDAEKAIQEKGNLSGGRQERSLEFFISNIQAYKTVNAATSILKGFGVLVTKTDRIQGMLDVLDRAQLERFMAENLTNGWAALLSLCNDFKIRPRLFYNFLHPTAEFGQAGQRWFNLDSNQNLEYPRDQYDLSISWFRGLAQKKDTSSKIIPTYQGGALNT